MQYLTSTQVAEIIGCSKSAAREIMYRMPLFRPSGQGRGKKMYVSKDDLDAFIAANTLQPGIARPRVTPYEAEKQRNAKDRAEWHRQRRATRK